MRLINADTVKLMFKRCGFDEEAVDMIVDSIPTQNAVLLPCHIGSDCWWVDSETQEVECEKEGITGFIIRTGETLALDLMGEPREIHSELCCLSREEAEMMKAKLFP